MSKSVLVVGYGPGISNAVAELFGAKGFRVGLVGRSEDKLAAGATALAAKGVEASAFVGDAADAKSIRAAVKRARDAFGGLTALHWNAAAGAVGDLTTIAPEALLRALEVGTVGLLSAVQEALPALEESRGSVLITNGALGDVDPHRDAAVIKMNIPGAALANATKHKLVGLLAARLKEKGVYVGEVVVAGLVKGTPSDKGNATLDPVTVAQKFWDLQERRTETRARVT